MTDPLLDENHLTQELRRALDAAAAVGEAIECCVTGDERHARTAANLAHRTIFNSLSNGESEDEAFTSLERRTNSHTVMRRELERWGEALQALRTDDRAVVDELAQRWRGVSSLPS